MDIGTNSSIVKSKSYFVRISALKQTHVQIKIISISVIRHNSVLQRTSPIWNYFKIINFSAIYNENHVKSN